MEPTVLPRDHFRASLLMVIGEVRAHGYDMPALLEPLGLGRTDRGFVYRTLRAMESEGLVTSAWAPSPGGPRRRSYMVTPTGREWAAEASESLREIDRQMAAWATRYRALRRRGGPHAFPGISEAS
jgi:PadR family transcriptional regulator PadR